MFLGSASDATHKAATISPSHPTLGQGAPTFPAHGSPVPRATLGTLPRRHLLPETGDAGGGVSCPAHTHGEGPWESVRARRCWERC